MYGTKRGHYLIRAMSGGEKLEEVIYRGVGTELSDFKAGLV